jgi:hypothetical protein
MSEQAVLGFKRQRENLPQPLFVKEGVAHLAYQYRQGSSLSISFGINVLHQIFN